ncbi:hypothetical protein BDR22DRAFT_891569 [Usnea florida]
MANSNRGVQAQHEQELLASLHRIGYPPTYSNPLFTQFTSPHGRGLGLRATRDIPRGTPILHEQLLFSLVDGSNFTAPKSAVAGFRTLFCPGRCQNDQERFDVNCFPMGTDAHGDMIRGIFLQAARINHSCVPNAYPAWNPDLDRLTVHAIVNIPEGDEIFINYHAAEYRKGRDQRRQHLLYDYGFRCFCPACRNHTVFGRASEERRTQMRGLYHSLETNPNPTLINDRVRQHGQIELFIALLRKEGLVYPQLMDVYQREIDWQVRGMELEKHGNFIDQTARAQCISGHREKALEFARMVLDMDVICNGTQSPQVTETLTKTRHLIRM